MNTHTSERYNSIAIGLHWLIAILIIGMLAIGKYMTSMPEDEPVRFALTQWHKSFGIAILLFSLFRLFWRAIHKAPPIPADTPRWERRAAGLTHFALYSLMILIPLTGWIMVSASPLALKTVLFQSITWPHVPGIDSLNNKTFIAGLFHEIHEIASSLLIFLLLLHIGAALKHHFVSKDAVMSRMSPKDTNGKTAKGFKPFIAFIVALIIGGFALAFTVNKSVPLSAGNNSVNFTAVMFESDIKGVFTESIVDISLDPENPAHGTLDAVVKTASLVTGDSQIDLSTPDPDWFDVTTHPDATFKSTSISATETGTYRIEGDLTIKDTTRAVSFEMLLNQATTPNTATGEFSINRLDYNLGKTGQPTDDTVGFNVLIGFSLELN